MRQQFTGQQRDNETGLDYFNARYYASIQGRFTSPDPLSASGHPMNPQSWNRYSYVLNKPLKLVDPDGEIWIYHYLDDEHTRIGIAWIDGNKIPKSLQAQGYHALNFGGASSRDVALTDGSVVRLSATSKNPLQLRGPDPSSGNQAYVNTEAIREFNRQTAPIPAATGAFILLSLNGGFLVAGSSIAALDAAAYALYAARATNDQDQQAIIARTQSQIKYTTQGGMTNIETDVTKSEFIQNLVDSGFKVSRSGGATILEKGGVRFSVYDQATSTGGPSAAKAIVSTGEETMKVRLKP